MIELGQNKITIVGNPQNPSAWTVKLDLNGICDLMEPFIVGLCVPSSNQTTFQIKTVSASGSHELVQVLHHHCTARPWHLLQLHFEHSQ